MAALLMKSEDVNLSRIVGFSLLHAGNKMSVSCLELIDTTKIYKKNNFMFCQMFSGGEMRVSINFLRPKFMNYFFDLKFGLMFSGAEM